MTNEAYYGFIDSDYDPKSVEESVLRYWIDNDIFAKSVNSRDEFNQFVFYDGPPFANGLPHYGHLLTGFIKDAFARYHTMLGKRVERRLGWDCHGLPAELAVQKELDISGKLAIQKFGVGEFNSLCARSVTKYTNEWRSYLARQGRWVDFNHEYKTMDMDFMESVIWIFKRLHQKGLIYRSMKVVPYSWACQTVLSNFETKIDDCYRQKESKAVTVMFRLKQHPKIPGEFINYEIFALAWTTTPWSLTSNLALAVGGSITYTVAFSEKALYVFCNSYTKAFSGICKEREVDFSIVRDDLSSSELFGIGYYPVFDYFVGREDKSFRILIGDFVNDKDGTGIVHVAPGFGEDDYNLCVSQGMSVVCPVDDSGLFTKEVPDFIGRHAFECNEDIISKLKDSKRLLKVETVLHDYPHCWRTDTPLMYRCVSSWYLAVSEIRDKLIELNSKINWIPGFVGSGQFHNWLAAAGDWAISRNRFWGTPIPVWESDDPKYPRIDVYGSVEEIQRDFKVNISDLHLPGLDKLTRTNPDDPSGQSKMKRVPEVLDCWFESGSMPYAQFHYPFEHDNDFKNKFPADFITEYIAQTRGWFYTLLIISVALMEDMPFKNCVCHGVVLDIKGKKLSKRLNNYSDPIDVFDKYGADSLRFLMLSSGAAHGNNMMLDKDCLLVKDVLRTVIKQIHSSARFFIVYANMHGVVAEIIKLGTALFDNKLDLYIVNKLFYTISAIRDNMDVYEVQKACLLISEFFDVFNNWYIRRSRKRFIDNEVFVFNLTYTVLHSIISAIAPVLPFLAEYLWLKLRFKPQESVHLAFFPSTQDVDINIVKEMEFFRGICNSALSIRNANLVKVRQPLRKLAIYYTGHYDLTDFYRTMVLEEVNVKSIIIDSAIKDLVKKDIKVNFRVLGKRNPGAVKDVISAINLGVWEIVGNNLVIDAPDGKQFTLLEDEFSLLLSVTDNKAAIFADGSGVMLLDTELDDELLMEGRARDLVRFIQQGRKDLNMHMPNKVDIFVRTNDDILREATAKWLDYIVKNVFARNIKLAESYHEQRPPGEWYDLHDFDDSGTAVSVMCVVD